MRHSQSWILAAMVVAAAGCGGDHVKVASVSGRVTLDGKPLANAFVQFQPMASGQSIETPGPPSVGTTDADGRFELTLSQGGKKGAVIGQHRVRFSTFREESKAKDSDETEVTQRETVPPQYNARSEVTFIVPESGSTTADFALDAKARPSDSKRRTERE